MSRVRRLRTLKLAALLIAVLGSTSFLIHNALAQTQMLWSRPVDFSTGIADTPPQGWGAVVAADQEGTVHAAWPECSVAGDDCKADTIYYSVWRNGVWSHPVDILAAPIGETVVVQSLRVDPYGRLVLVWTQNRGINISSADSTKAESAQFWTTLTLAQDDAVRTGDLFINGAGVYNLVYIVNDRAVKYAVSTDAGMNWLDSLTVYSEERSDAGVIAPKIAIDENGSVSVCWTTVSEATNWGATGVQFANSHDGGVTWGPAQSLVTGQGYGSCTLLADSKHRLHAFWLGSASIGGRYHRWSTDSGDTWTDTEAVVAPGEISGFPGAPSLTEDSDGIIHSIFAGYNTSGEQIWHASWNGDNWTRPSSISSSLPHSEKPSATISQGKYLHVVWLEYDSLDFWHSFADTGTALIEIEPLPIPTPQIKLTTPIEPTSEAQSTIAESHPVTVTLGHAPIVDTRPIDFNSNVALLLSIVPALLLVGGIIVIRLMKRR